MIGSATRRTMDHIRSLIRTGQLPSSGHLPSERCIAQSFNVSRSTVRNALHLLQQQGEINIRSGRNGGAYVSPENPYWSLYAQAPSCGNNRRRLEHPTGLPTGIPEAVAQQGAIPKTQVEFLRIRDPDELTQEHLMLTKTQKVLEARRTRTVDGVPISHEIAFLPYDRFPQVDQCDFTQSVYSIITVNYATTIGRVTESLQVMGANQHEAQILNTPSGSPVIFSESTVYDERGTPIEYSRDYFRPDQFLFVVDHSFE